MVFVRWCLRASKFFLHNLKNPFISANQENTPKTALVVDRHAVQSNTDNVFAHIRRAWSNSPDLHSSPTPETRFGAYIIFIVAQRPFDGPPFAWLRIHSRAHHPHAYIVLQYLSSQTRVWFAVVNLATSAAWNEYISLSAKIDVNFPATASGKAWDSW